MLFDTDVLIWAQRSNENAANLINKTKVRELSIYSYMELLQGAHNKLEHKYIKDFIFDYQFNILPLTENIGHRASVYIAEYSLSHGLRAGDALIAATATESNTTLTSANRKHFKPIRDLQLQIFKP